MLEQLYFAQKAFIVYNNRLLLIRKSNNAPHCAGKWEVPGGRMEVGDSIDSHLRREVYEEVGIDIVAIEPFFVWEWYVNKNEETQQHIIAVAVLCFTESSEIALNNQDASDYIDAYQWVDYSEIGTYDYIADMNPAIMRFIEKYGKLLIP